MVKEKDVQSLSDIGNGHSHSSFWHGFIPYIGKPFLFGIILSSDIRAGVDYCTAMLLAQL